MNGSANHVTGLQPLATLGLGLCALLATASVALTATAGGPTAGGAAARPLSPSIDASVAIDDRIDARVTLLDPRVEGLQPEQVVPSSTTPQKRTRAIPYRVEPVEADDGAIGNAWELPPEVPDARDFERVDTYDALANPHYEIREEMWKTPEDFISPNGVIGNPDGIAYVPFWARNAIRWGRLQVFPFVSEQGVFSSVSVGGGAAEQNWHLSSTAGFLSEYLFEGGRTKLKLGARATYDWAFSGNDSNVSSYVGGLSLETRLGCYLTLHGGIEFERGLCSPVTHQTIDDEEHITNYWSAFGDLMWDRFLADDLRLEVGGRYSVTDLQGHEIGDHEDLSLYGRVSWAIMRHEAFAYAQYKYEERDAHGGAADLKHAEEIDVGLNNILPHGRTRRLDGDVYVGYRWEKYSDDGWLPGPSPLPGERTPETWVWGATLTYRPSPYTSGYVAFEHVNTFSTFSTFNASDRVTLGVTQNLSNKLVGRIVAEWSRTEPDGYSDVDRLGLGAGVRWCVSDSIDFTADYEYRHRWEGAGFDYADSHRVAVGVTVQIR